VEISKELKVQGADAVVISACVQMPSLEAIPAVEERLGLPVVSAAVCTTYHMLKQLGLETKVPNAGRSCRAASEEGRPAAGPRSRPSVRERRRAGAVPAATQAAAKTWASMSLSAVAFPVLPFARGPSRRPTPA
jgi:hypothetical protein